MKKTVLNLAILISSGLTMAQSITDNLVAHYEFTNGSMTDLSGNGNDAVNVGSTVTTGVGGNANEAMNLASGNHIVLPSGILLERNIAVSLWFKTGNVGAILGMQNSNATSTPSQRVPVVYIRNDNKLKASFYSGNTRTVNLVNVNYRDNNWHHLVMVVKGTSQVVYIDGVNKGVLGSAHQVLPGMTFSQIGRAYTKGWPEASQSGWSNFFGQIDKVRIYDTWISSSSVTNIYDAEKDGTVIAGLHNTTEVEELTIFPNPTSDIINTEKGQIEISNTSGSVVLNTISDGIIDVSTLTKGIYFVSQNGKKTKLVIE